MTDRRKLRVVAFGAHPDDCDIKAGGVATKYARLGHRVCFVSLTNGDTGHHEIGGIELARRRRTEAEAAARVAGIEYRIFDIHNGELTPCIEYRRQVIRCIREMKPDLIMTHRPNDYHPDHRAASELVQDACYLCTVPNNVALADHLPRMPVVVYFEDNFQKPNPFTPDIAVDIDDVADKKLDMLHCHESQMYEWLPYNNGILSEVPKSDSARRKWLASTRSPAMKDTADRSRETLVRLHGEKRGRKVRCAEAFEACEYGTPLKPQMIPRLFPFY